MVCMEGSDAKRGSCGQVDHSPGLQDSQAQKLSCRCGPGDLVRRFSGHYFVVEENPCVDRPNSIVLYVLLPIVARMQYSVMIGIFVSNFSS